MDFTLDYSAISLHDDTYSLQWERGLRSTQKKEKDDLRHFNTLYYRDEELEKKKLSDFNKQSRFMYEENPAWVGLKTKYFVFTFWPLNGEIEKTYFERPAEKHFTFTLEPAIEGGKGLVQEFGMYCGPIDYFILEEQGQGMEKIVDMGWSVIRPIAKVILIFMVNVHKVVPNFGLVIIILSMVTKILFWPLTHKSYKSMRDMKNLQPEMSALKEKYKDNPKKLNEEMMKLYRKRGVNPIGGCLPLILQMPVFFALFRILNSTINVRGEAFLWCSDLSNPDIILVVLMGVSMFVQQKLSVTDPKQAYMTYIMPVVFTFIFISFPAGLVLYWLVNNLLAIIQQFFIHRSAETA
jgi:YidC/Oxa1 family membrane protein insertase